MTAIGPKAFYSCYVITIHGNKGSYAQKYANEYGILFQDIEIKQVN
ncbi:MAG: hypothetical protein K2N15_12400 [Lachnospiraceae bacterium]|nr:hypothetical protein [Lachnospiraceae bacterium]